MVCPHYWSPIICRSSAGQGKFASQRPTFYHCATQPGCASGLFRVVSRSTPMARSAADRRQTPLHPPRRTRPTISRSFSSSRETTRDSTATRRLQVSGSLGHEGSVLKFPNPEPWFGKQAVNAVSMSCKRRPSHQQNDYPFVINHDAIESLPLSYRPLGVIRKTDHGRVVDITCIPTTCCGEIFLSPQCRNCSRDPDHAHKTKTSHGRPVYKI